MFEIFWFLEILIKGILIEFLLSSNLIEWFQRELNKNLLIIIK